MSKPAAGKQSASDLSEIEAVARDYVEGWYAGDVARMDRALHSELSKRILASEEHPPGDLRTVTKERMIELTAAGGGDMLNPEYQVEVYNLSDNIASAGVLSPEYLDYLHLVKTPEGWKIANILFRVRSGSST